MANLHLHSNVVIYQAAISRDIELFEFIWKNAGLAERSWKWNEKWKDPTKPLQAFISYAN